MSALVDRHAGALPEALDSSEEGTRLVLRGVRTQDESLASSEELAAPNLALGALEPEGDLLGLLGLLSEDGLGLTTETRLLGLIAARTLRHLGVLALLVLSNLEFHVFLAKLAVRHFRFGSVHLTQRVDELATAYECGRKEPLTMINYYLINNDKTGSQIASLLIEILSRSGANTAIILIKEI